MSVIAVPRQNITTGEEPAVSDRGHLTLVRDESGAGEESTVVPLKSWLIQAVSAIAAERLDFDAVSLLHKTWLQHHDAAFSATTELTAQEYAEEYGLARAIKTCEALLREVFGDSARVEIHLDPEPESGASEFVLEAHYCLSENEADLDRLLELHEAFLRRYQERIGPEVRARIVLTWISFDADCA